MSEDQVRKWKIQKRPNRIGSYKNSAGDRLPLSTRPDSAMSACHDRYICSPSTHVCGEVFSEVRPFNDLHFKHLALKSITASANRQKANRWRREVGSASATSRQVSASTTRTSSSALDRKSVQGTGKHETVLQGFV